MRTIFALLVFTACAFAEDKPTSTAIAPGCGPANVKFDVSADGRAHPISQPEAGKALVYFIEDDTNFLSTPKPTTRLGVDGSWVGANHGNSYFYLSLDPGEHHLCASWQSKVVLLAGQQTAVAHFTAEAGKAYFFRAQNVWNQNSATTIELGPVDSDQAQLLMSKFSFTTSRPKK